MSGAKNGNQAPFPWQRQAWQQLLQSRRDGRIAHALLFAGAAGTGKSLLARQFAYSLLCSQPDESGLACGQCRECRLLEAGTHPDFHLVAPEEGSKNIRIDAIRQLQEESALVVGEGRSRVFLLDPAEAMGTAAANALLKTLEEPPPGVHLLLVTSRPEQLPVTIRSRCQQLPLRQPPEKEALAWLLEQRGLEADRAAWLLQLAGGGPVAARALLDSGAEHQYRDFLQALGDLARGEANPSRVAESWLSATSLETSLRLLANWLLALLRTQAAPHVADPQGKLLDEKATVPVSRNLHRLLDNLFESQRRLAHNPNPQLVLESLLLEWQRITES